MDAQQCWGPLAVSYRLIDILDQSECNHTQLYDQAEHSRLQDKSGIFSDKDEFVDLFQPFDVSVSRLSLRRRHELNDGSEDHVPDLLRL